MTSVNMMDHRLRWWFGFAVLCFSVLAYACSCSKRDANPMTVGPPAYEGFVANISCKEGIRAWGWDMMRPNDTITLAFYDGETLVDSATADVFGEDLLKAGKGNGKHYVTWPIPVRFQDGKPHTITVKFEGTTLEVPLARGGPIEPITCNLEK